MIKKTTLFFALLLLTGCVGSSFSGKGDGYLEADFPDIRSVPSRDCVEAIRCARKDKCGHAVSCLEGEREKLKARDALLREKAFGSPKGPPGG